MNELNPLPRTSGGTQPNTKRAYSAPTIEQFGDIKTITLTVGMNGMRDGGTQMGMMMTRA